MYHLVELAYEKTFCVLQDSDVISCERHIGAEVIVINDGMEFRAKILETSEEKPPLVRLLKEKVKKREAEKRLQKNPGRSLVAGTSRFGRQRLPTKGVYEVTTSSAGESEIESEAPVIVEPEEPYAPEPNLELLPLNEDVAEVDDERALNLPPGEPRRLRERMEEQLGGSLDDESTQSNLALLTYRKVCLIARQLSQLSTKVSRLETLIQRPFETANLERFNTITNEDDYASFVLKLKNKQFRESVIQQLKFVGGVDAKDTIRRMINRLLSVQMQTHFNRTGAHDRLCFTENLEPLVADALQQINVGNFALMEETIRRTLKDASDREGGRRRRMSSEAKKTDMSQKKERRSEDSFLGASCM